MVIQFLVWWFSAGDSFVFAVFPEDIWQCFGILSAVTTGRLVLTRDAAGHATVHETALHNRNTRPPKCQRCHHWEARSHLMSTLAWLLFLGCLLLRTLHEVISRVPVSCSEPCAWHALNWPPCLATAPM